MSFFSLSTFVPALFFGMSSGLLYADDFSAAKAYVADAEERSVLEIDLATGAQSVIFSEGLLSFPTGLVFGNDNEIFSVNSCDSFSFSAPSVVRLDLGSGSQQAIKLTCGFYVPSDIAIDRRPQAMGTLYVLDEDAVYRVDPFTGATEHVTAQGKNIQESAGNGIDVDQNGDVLATNNNIISSNYQVLRIDPATGEETVIIEGQDMHHLTGMGLATDIFGDIYIGGEGAGATRSIVRVNPETGEQETVFRSELLSRVGDMTFSSFNELLFMTIPRPIDPSETRILRIDLQNGKAEIVTAGTFTDPSAITTKPVTTIPVSLQLKQNRFLETASGKLEIAILSEIDVERNHFLDPLQIDANSVRAGPGKAAPLEQFTKVRDVNRDGLPDLVLRFSLREVNLSCDIIDLYVHGMLLTGDTFAGRNSVEVLGCTPGE